MTLVVTRPRVPPNAPWHEVARLFHPRRIAFQMLIVGGSMGAGWVAYQLTSPISRIPAIWVAFLSAALFSVFPVVIGERALRPLFSHRATSRDERNRNLVALFLLFWVPILPTLLGLLFLPTEPGPATWAGMFVLAIACLVVSSGVQIRLAEWLGVVHPARERLQQSVDRASQRIGRSPKAVKECDLLMANAFAFVWTGDLLFTRPTVEELTDAELEAVAMHELSHLTEPLKVRLSRLGLVPVMWFTGVMRSIYAMGGEIALFALGGFAMISMVLMQRVAKRMETEADQIASTTVADTPAYAHALEKIYRLNMVPAALPRRGEVHPDLYDRMTAAGAPPDYPRPDPPNMRPTFFAGLVIAVGVATLLVAVPGIADRLARLEAPVSAERALWLVGLHGSHQSFEAAADVAIENNRAEAASAFLRVALQKDSDCLYAAYQLTMIELHLGRCDKAESAAQAFASLAEKSRDPNDLNDAGELRRLVEKCHGER